MVTFIEIHCLLFTSHIIRWVQYIFVPIMWETFEMFCRTCDMLSVNSC